MFKRFLALLVFLTVLATRIFAAHLPYGRVQPLLEHDITICSTFSVNEPKGRWLTAAHCVAENVQDHTTSYLSIMGSPVTVKYINLDWDVAVLEGAHVNAIPVASTVEKGETVHVIGYPNNLHWEGGEPIMVVEKGQVLEDNVVLGVFNPFSGPILRPFAVHQIDVAPGHSGSPIVNSSGEVVSMVQVLLHPMNPETGKPLNVKLSAGLPLQVLQEAVAEAGMEIK